MTVSGRQFAEEIADLHGFFDDWFAGRAGRNISEFADRLDPGFTIVNPHGEVVGKEALVGVFQQRFGAYAVAITTSGATLAMTEPVLLGTYEEHRRTGDEMTRLIATVAMVVDEQTPTGYRWLSVHETWIEDEG
jgi:hypothetical protein